MEMKVQFKAFLGHVKILAETYGVIAGSIGILWGIFVAINSFTTSNKQLHKDVSTIISTQKEQTKTDSLLLRNQFIMGGQITEIKASTDANADNFKSLQSSYVKYISNDKTLTKQDFLKYMDGLSFDVKKNLLNNVNGTLYPMYVQQNDQNQK